MERKGNAVQLFFGSRKGKNDVIKHLDSIALSELKELCLEILKVPSRERQKEELMVTNNNNKTIRSFEELPIRSISLRKCWRMMRKRSTFASGTWYWNHIVQYAMICII